MSAEFLTVIYDMSQPGMKEKAQLLLKAADWTASGWSHAFSDRDEARDSLKRYQNQMAIAPPVVAGSVDTMPRFEPRWCNDCTAEMGEDTDGEWVKHTDAIAWGAQQAFIAVEEYKKGLAKND